jgi:two-component system response regulator
MTTQQEVEVLLIEDNARDAEHTVRTLTKRNLASRITHLKDGRQALDWLFGLGAFAGRNPSVHPKVVLLDLKLPKLDGLEVLRAIRADERTRLLPVVALTSSREERDVIECYRLGVNSYVVKPVDFDSFSSVVAEVGHYWLLVNHEPR